MFVNEIYKAACAICSADCELLHLMAASAAEELAYKLKPDADISEFSELFISAAALFASGMYLGAAPEQSFKAGSLSVSSAKTTRTAEEMIKRAELMLSGYLNADGFAFTGVRG